jgi:hypothetical protein
MKYVFALAVLMSSHCAFAEQTEGTKVAQAAPAAQEAASDTSTSLQKADNDTMLIELQTALEHEDTSDTE